LIGPLSAICRQKPEQLKTPAYIVLQPPAGRDLDISRLKQYLLGRLFSRGHVDLVFESLDHRIFRIL
jgi:hypothetical protein